MLIVVVVGRRGVVQEVVLVVRRLRLDDDVLVVGGYHTIPISLVFVSGNLLAVDAVQRDIIKRANPTEGRE
jgi:hypothetical protein